MENLWNSHPFMVNIQKLGLSIFQQVASRKFMGVNAVYESWFLRVFRGLPGSLIPTRFQGNESGQNVTVTSHSEGDFFEMITSEPTVGCKTPPTWRIIQVGFVGG